MFVKCFILLQGYNQTLQYCIAVYCYQYLHFNCIFHNKILTLNKEMTCERIKVAVLGAAGGIGQPLSLLIQMDPNVDEIALFDVVSE